jgi:hypothetical protein
MLCLANIGILLDRTPLTVKNSPTNSFLLPRWGGIHIYNYHEAGEDNFKFPAKISVDMARVMGIWLGQLRILLGVKERPGLSALPVPHSGLRQGHVIATLYEGFFFFGMKFTCFSGSSTAI